mmetsp:Transcript_877/g.2524  ORF Transcript_877/g.2524 Transcript_877/m.2524 type:complete len:204 (+) Transcript_877:152-763(+)
MARQPRTRTAVLAPVLFSDAKASCLVSSRDPVAQLKHVLCESQRSLESPTPAAALIHAPPEPGRVPCYPSAALHHVTSGLSLRRRRLRHPNPLLTRSPQTLSARPLWLRKRPLLPPGAPWVSPRQSSASFLEEVVSADSCVWDSNHSATQRLLLDHAPISVASSRNACCMHAVPRPKVYRLPHPVAVEICFRAIDATSHPAMG